MDPNKVCREWDCKMIRIIPDAKQVVISEFVDSTGPKVHTFRLNDEQWSNLTTKHIDSICRIEEYARCRDYEVVKEELKWYATNGYQSPPVEESCIKFKRLSPSQWFLKHCYADFPSPDAASVKAAAFAEAWGAAWGTIETPEFVFGSSSIVEIYAECGRGRDARLTSCMTDHNRVEFTQIYGTSKRCCLAVLREDNGELVERALMFLPDSMPEDTPPGAGWYVGRIYPGDTALSRSRMGPWFAANGVKSLRAEDRHLQVSGFEFGDEMYLPYLDIGCFAWPCGGQEPGTAVTWHHNMPRDVRTCVNCYPGTWGNDYMGGPFATPQCRCGNCGEEIDEEEAVHPTDCEPWCRDCTDYRFSWCDISSGYVEHDDMIEVRGCYMYDRVSRHVNSFRSSRNYGGDRIRYVQVELADGDRCFVPECEAVDGRWLPDMEENGWVRMPFLSLGYRDSWRPSVSSLDSDDWSWENPDDSNTVEVKVNDDETLTMKVFYGGLQHELNWQVRRLGLHWISLQGCALGIADNKGGRYRAVPRLREYAQSYIVGATLTRDQIDLTNDVHLQGLDSSAIEGWDIVLIEDNTNTADTAETASNL